MRLLWCWRCRMHLPMLDEDEWAVVVAAHRVSHDDPVAASSILADEGARRGLLPPRPVPPDAGLVRRRFWHLTAGYEMFTGAEETNPNAIWHHRASLYGPPCPDCGKPLRTPQARLCAACGWGMGG